MTANNTTAPANSVAKPTGIKSLIVSDAFKAQITPVLPKHITPERQVRVALTTLARTPKLAECEPASFFQCLLTLSQYGLEPDGRHAHLIPFENRKRGVVECQLIIDYKGLVDLAMRSGKVANIHADTVCEHDEFEFDRGELKKHKIDFRKPRGAVYAVYALCRFKDGTEKCEVMTRDEVESIRRRSKAGTNGPWVTDWNEMAKKTVFRRLSKWLPLSSEFRDAVDADDDTLIDTSRVVHTTVDAPAPEAKTRSDELAALLMRNQSSDVGEESQEESVDGNDAVSYWLGVIAEARDRAALIRKHERFDSVRADLTTEEQEQIEAAFAARMAAFGETTPRRET
jgi:recombination protein RecT